VFAAAVGLLGGCPTRPNPDVANLICDHATHICVGTIAITSPGPVTYTNKAVAIQITTTPADNPPASIQILRDGASLVSLSPPFSYNWETANEAEGSHQIGATAAVGGDTITASPVTVIVDRTSPSITQTLPAPNATNVALSDPIQVVFSEALDSSSVTSAAVSLSSGGATLSTDATLSADGKTITVTLTSRAGLSFPANITATVSGAIKDLSGNSLGSVPNWTWTAPLWVQLPSSPGYAPTVALDSTGKPTVAFLTDAGKLMVARYAPGAVWDLGVGSPTTGTVTAASLAIDPADALVVGWSDSHVNVSRRAGTTWSAVGASGDAGATAADSVTLSSMQLDSSGAPAIAWTGFSGISNPGYVAQWSGSSWDLLPAGTSAGAGGPLLRLESGGTPVGLFPGSLGVTPALARYASGSWVTIDSSMEASAPLDFALNAQNAPIILTHATESNVEVIHVRIHQATTWTDLVPSLTTGVAGLVAGANLQLDSAGNPLVLWSQPDSSTNSKRLRVARYNGTSWDTTYGILKGAQAPGSGSQYFSLAVDKTSAPTVAWSETDTASATTSVYVSKSNY
jgi:hypothetical protein